MKLLKINLLIVILALIITAINIFLVCQRQDSITQIEEKIEYLETQNDTEYIEEYMQDHGE